MRTARRVDYQKKRPRLAAVLVCVLICLAVSSALLVAIVNNAFLRREHSIRRYREYQALWLVESGLERAAAQLGGNASYQGETWHIPKTQLSGQYGAVVQIAVLPSEEKDGATLVRCSADYPAHEIHRVRHSRQITIRSNSGDN